ncbi:unnamed protein product [Musa acuminata subsp. malaccensis]|uniref:chitinase n=1 Tax=Musa acuminata subsp. malaccensis TaxID=214687 RepID=A0A804ICD0_MUSAM|nr:unnamed protein product [Musa acuminata subsp. malaccensis]
MLKHRDDAACPAKGFYTYDAFVAAAAAFRGFATTGDADTRKREVATFLAQTSHETTGGWATAPDGPFAWGYCYLQEQGDPSDYCPELSVPIRCRQEVLRPRAFPDLLVRKLSLTPRTKSLLSIPAILALT